MGQSQLWSFIRNFSAAKFYEAAQIGALTGAAPFSFGAVFAQGVPPGAGEFVFGNFTASTGFGLLSNQLPGGSITAVNGTVAQETGPITVATGAQIVDGSTADLANAFKSAYTEPGGAVLGVSSAKTPTAQQLVHLCCTVSAAANQLYYVNGKLIATHAVGLATNANAMRIGVNNPVTAPMSASWLAGCFYHNAVYSPAEVGAMAAACMQMRDLVGPSKLIGAAIDPTYMWSVKRGNPDARPSWLSDGSAATPIAMTRNGLWTVGGTDSDVFASDLPWSTV